MTQIQIEQMVECINAMLDRAREAIFEIRDICDPEYYQGRDKYPITALVYTGFNVEEQNIPGFIIQKVLYGGKKKMYLPELFNDEILIEVFSDGANPCSTDEVKTKLKLFGSRLHLLIFSVDKNDYTSVMSITSGSLIRNSICLLASIPRNTSTPSTADTA